MIILLIFIVTLVSRVINGKYTMKFLVIYLVILNISVKFLDVERENIIVLLKRHVKWREKPVECFHVIMMHFVM